MINSLFKDSHITQTLCRPTTYHSEVNRPKSERTEDKKYSVVSVNNNQGIIANKPAEISFSGLTSANKTADAAEKPVAWIFKSPWVKKQLEKAADNQIVFSAGFALLLTCLLRPGTIMALPGDKKNKDDKKYAAAHSIASGTMGFVISFLVANPISEAVKKIKKHPGLFLKDKTKIEYFKKGGKELEAAGNYLNRLPDIMIAAPKAIITIAIIPPILKYVFGWEKKNPKNGQGTPVEPDFSLLNFKSADAQSQKRFQNFVGGAK